MRAGEQKRRSDQPARERRPAERKGGPARSPPHENEGAGSATPGAIQAAGHPMSHEKRDPAGGWMRPCPPLRDHLFRAGGGPHAGGGGGTGRTHHRTPNAGPPRQPQVGECHAHEPCQAPPPGGIGGRDRQALWVSQPLSQVSPSRRVSFPPFLSRLEIGAAQRPPLDPGRQLTRTLSSPTGPRLVRMMLASA